jgi:glyoxylase-like metal-dependent hydrolase (beta-lactamase superfamily II)
MFGDEWPATRMFPTHPVADGGRVSVDGATFRAVDVGPAESPHDSWWVLESDGPPRIFAGDLVYNHMHAYLADGFYDEWLQALQRAKRELPAETRLFIGHGDPPTGLDIVGWQIGYIDALLGALRTGEQDALVGDALAEAVARRMKSYLPSDDLEFLMRLSVEPVRRGHTREADV